MTATTRQEERPAIKLLADQICEENHFAQDASGTLYRFSDGCYRQRGDAFVKAQVKRICVEQSLAWSSLLAIETIRFIQADAPMLWERPPLDVVNVANGLLRIRDRKLLPHSPDHLSPIQLPISYDPEACCPAIDRFVSEVFPRDAIDLAYEVPGWLMLPDISIQKAVLLAGDGANGKSTFCNLLSKFLGTGNTAAISLHKLEGNKFAIGRLVGKLANICPDLPSEHLAGTSVFKALVGGDMMGAEHKYGDHFEFQPFCRLLFSANHLPRSSDSSHGFFRRWLVVPFDRQFSEAEAIPRDELDARLTAPEELSGLLNRALDALDRIRGQKGFSESETCKAASQDFRQTTDPLAVWLERSTILDPGMFVPKAALRDAYNMAAEKAGRPILGNKAFGSAVKRAFPSVQDSQRKVNGRLTECYVGIGLRSKQEEAA